MSQVTGGRRPAAWAFCRAVGMAYGFAIAPLAGLLFVLLPVFWLVVTRVTKERHADPWWPLVRWIQFIDTLPRLAGWLEQRFCAPVAAAAGEAAGARGSV